MNCFRAGCDGDQPLADSHYIFSLRSFWALGHGHLDLLTLPQSATAICNNCGVVNKNILAARLFNKPKSLFVIKPLDGTFNLLCHISLCNLFQALSPVKIRRPLSTTIRPQFDRTICKPNTKIGTYARPKSRGFIGRAPIHSSKKSENCICRNCEASRYGQPDRASLESVRLR